METLGLFCAIAAAATAILLMPLIIFVFVENHQLKKEMKEDERNCKD